MSQVGPYIEGWHEGRLTPLAFWYLQLRLKMCKLPLQLLMYDLH